DLLLELQQFAAEFGNDHAVHDRWSRLGWESADGLQLQSRHPARAWFQDGARCRLRGRARPSPAAGAKSQHSTVWEAVSAVEPGSDDWPAVVGYFPGTVFGLWADHSVRRVRKQFELSRDASAGESPLCAGFAVGRDVDVVEVDGFRQQR